MPDDRPVFSGKMLLFACIATVGAALLAYETLLPHAAFSEPRDIAIAKRMGSRKIGALLKREGVIRSKWAFVTYVSLRGIASSLKPGTYAFGNDPIFRIADMLVAGGKNEKEITVPEGWTVRDIGVLLERQGVGTAGALETLVSPAAAALLAGRFAFLADKPASAGLEGYLFPDTYRLPEDAVPEDAVIKMLENFDRRVDAALRRDIAEQKKGLFAVVVMASLIEKEVVSDEDRALVSGILWKRLDAGMPLQVDATVVYAKTQLGNSVSKLGDTATKNEKISLEDTRISSPYNTYRHRGLPPGPIANPGLSAIRAAIYPKPSPYLYYLSAPDGRTIFSRTLDEHNAAKAKYLR